MKLRQLTAASVIAAVLISPFAISQATAADQLYLAGLVYRTGPYAPNGTPFANGFKDYVTLLNERDGGLNGVKIVYEECATGYNTKVGVECYEQIKGNNPLAIIPNSTGITYQLIPKVTVDKIPLVSMGYGRTSAAVGSVFPWVFNFPTTYWSQATAVIRYIAEQEGGFDNLKGKKIAHVYHNSAYGKEANPTLTVLSEKYGFSLMLLAVDHPGQEQKATWLQIRKKRPDYVFMSGWGIMNSTAIKEAASINFPMDKFIGNWWSGSENDVMPAGDAADGYLSGAFHAPGGGFPVHDDIRKHVYDKGLGKGDRDRIGEVLYNRGMVGAMWTTEAIRKAMEIHGTTEVTGKHVRDGFEALDVDEARLEELGLGGFTYPVKITCANHEGPGKVAVQQWDAKAKQWNIVSKFYEPLRDITGPLIEADSAAYAAENNVTPRDC